MMSKSEMSLWMISTCNCLHVQFQIRLFNNRTGPDAARNDQIVPTEKQTEYVNQRHMMIHCYDYCAIP